MKSLKSLASAVGAAIVLFASQAASASWSEPDAGTVAIAVDHISDELTQLAEVACVKAENVKAVHVETLLSAEELASLKAKLRNDETQRELIALRHALGNLKVLEGASITALKDVLNGNDFDIADVIGVVVSSDGRIVILGYGGRG